MNIRQEFKEWMRERVVPKATLFSEHAYVKSINFSLSIITPILLFGGLLLIILLPPGSSKGVLGFLQSFSFNKFDKLEMLFDTTMGILSIFIASGTAYQLSVIYKKKEQRLDPYSSAIIAAVIFFLLTTQQDMKFSLNLEYLSIKGYFLALIVGVVTVEVNVFLLRYNVQFKMNPSIPPAVSTSFSALIPLLVNVLFFSLIDWVCVSFFGQYLANIIYRLGSILSFYADTALFVIAVMTFSQLLWIVGVHGGSVTGVITSIFYKHNIIANGICMLKQGNLPYVMTGPLSVYLVVMGGAGATLGLSFLFRKSKSKHLQNVAKEGFLPSLFGINEPILYATPVVGNDIFDIPFVVTPLVNVILVYIIFGQQRVQRAYISLPWASPGIIGLPLATMDIKSVGVFLMILVIDILIYYPFFKKYEKQLLEKEGEI